MERPSSSTALVQRLTSGKRNSKESPRNSTPAVGTGKNVSPAAPVDPLPRSVEDHIHEVNGKPFICSGELFVRAHSEGIFSESGLLGGTEKSFQRLILNEKGRRRNDSIKLIRRAKRNHAKWRRNNIAVLQLEGSQAKADSKYTVSQAKERIAAWGDATEGALQQLDSHIRSLVVKWGEIMESELGLLDVRSAQNDAEYKQNVGHVNLTRRLGSLSLHAEWESCGGVVVRRLPTSHLQHVRCRRAASENIKPKFFDNSCLYSGTSVLEVYKVDNAELLRRFQRVAELDTAGKVKGLFCLVPESSLEHIIINGVGNSSTNSTYNNTTLTLNSMGDVVSVKDDTRRPVLCGSLANLALNGARTENGRVKNSGFVSSAMSKLLSRSYPVSAPLSFSRHSTLEEERAVIDNQSLRPNNAPIEDSPLRYLALCRVLTGRIFVGDIPPATSSSRISNKGSLSITHNGTASVVPPIMHGFDCSYSPLLEEYKIEDPDRILPEFIIACRFTARSTPPMEDDTTDRNGDSSGGEFVHALPSLRICGCNVGLSSVSPFPLVAKACPTCGAGGAFTEESVAKNSHAGTATDAQTWEYSKRTAAARRASIRQAIASSFETFRQNWPTLGRLELTSSPRFTSTGGGKGIG